MKKLSFELNPKSGNSRHINFEIRIENKPCKNYKTMQEENMACLSIVGSPRISAIMCQAQNEIMKYADRVPMEYKENFDKLMYVWDNYHLNDLTAGTVRQEEALKEWKKSNEYDYTAACNYLKSIDLYEDNGYRYGTSWLCREIPEDIVDFVNTLQF